MTTSIRSTSDLLDAMICLNTNAVIGLLNRRYPILHRRFEAQSVECCMSALVLFELQYGISKSSKASESAAKLHAFLRTLVTILPFDAADAVEAAEIRAALARLGTLIGPPTTP